MSEKTPQKNIERAKTPKKQSEIDFQGVDKAAGNTPSSEATAVGDDSRASSEVCAPGTIIDGKYKVLSLIGKGGMGTVYRVEQIFLLKEFALKTINGEFNESHWRRFEIEAKAASRLEHPNTVRVSDFGLLESKHPYFVMELVQGESLNDYLKRVGSLSYEDVFSIFIPLCWALQDAHSKGIIHRDVKPSNIMLIGKEGNWQCKLLDFGIAKVSEGELSALTQTGELIGSPHYMSPEQCSGNKIDHRSDIYSLGCTLFEAITSCPPFPGATAVATIGMHLHEKPPSLKDASMGKDFPADLERIVQTMLAKNPDERFHSVKSVAENLMRLQQGDKLKMDDGISADAKSTHASRVGEPQVNVILAGITVIAVGCAVYFWYQSTQVHSTSAPEENAEMLKDGRPARRDIDSFYGRDVPKSAPFCEAAYKINGVHMRRFRFPGRSLGVLVDSKTGRPYNMQGVQEIAWNGPMSFYPNSEALSNYPGLFDRFNNDEIHKIVFAKEQQFFMDSLEHLHSYRFLDELSFQDTDFKDDGLKFLEQMPNLSSLDVLTTNVTANTLAKFSGLKYLRELKLGYQTSMTKLLQALQTNRKMERLKLRYCKMSTGDYKLLASIPNLKYLTIDQGFLIGGDLLDALATCKTLRQLDLQHCMIEQKDFPSLAKLQQIEILDFSKGRFSPTQVKEMAKMLPHCKIVYH